MTTVYDLHAATEVPMAGNSYNKAWAARDAYGPIPAECLRTLRTFKSTLGVTAGLLERILSDDALAHDLVAEACRRRGMARQRRLYEIRRRFPAAKVEIAHKSILEMTWLTPRAHLLAAPVGGEQQDCILASFLLAWQSSRAVSFWSGWAAEIPDHAAARYLQRATADEAALRAALFAAGVAFMSASAAAVRRANDATVFVAAGPGAFVGEIINAAAGERRFTYFRARTWLSEDMLGPDQVPLPAATNPDETMMLALWRDRARAARFSPTPEQPRPPQASSSR
jgi:hypothetical protein